VKLIVLEWQLKMWASQTENNTQFLPASKVQIFGTALSISSTAQDLLWGHVSSVGTATYYWLDSPGIESRWGRYFLHPSRPGLGPSQPPIQWVPGLSRGLCGRSVALTTHPPTSSSAEVKERVEIYIYCPSGPSWPVLG